MARLYGKWFAPAMVQETPSGTVDGSNATFSLSQVPVAQLGAFALFMDGLLMQPTIDYTLSGQTITMVAPPTQNQSLFARYLQAN